MSKIVGISLMVCLAWVGLGCRETALPQPKILGEINIDPYGPGEVAINSETGNVYVLSSGAYVAVLQDTELVAFLPTEERRAISLTIDEERQWIYVANEYSDSVTILHETEVITTHKTVGREPLDIALEPKSGWAYAVSGYEDAPTGEKRVVAGNVTIVNGTQMIGSIRLGHVLATHVIADPVAGYVYVGSTGGTVVVLKGLEEIARFETGSTTAAMAVNPTTGEVYVLNDAINRNLTRFKNGQVVDTLKIRSDNPTENSALRNLKVNPVTGEVYVLDFVKHEVVLVQDMTIVGRAGPVGGGALKMALDPVNDYLYVANFRDDSVTVIHQTEVITTIETGWYPYGIGVNPTNGRVYVSNTNGRTITVLGLE